MAISSDDAETAEVTDLTHDGRGVAEVGGRRIFVAGALPSERVLLRTRRRRRRLQEAELVEVLEPSRARVAPPCPYFGTCGGCALQHLDYAAQVEFKQRTVAETLARIGQVEPLEWLEPLTGPQWHYRRRARLGIKYVEAKERVLVGFRERAKPYITDMLQCPILVQPLDRLPEALARIVAASSIRQQIPQAEIAVGDAGGALVVRVLAAPTAADVAAMTALADQFGVDLYVQPAGPDSVHPVGAAPRPLYYDLPDDGIRIGFEPGDFIQINAAINVAMVRTAVAAAAIAATDRVLDLYCGLGNFSLPIARRAESVLGVEGAAPLVARAARNAANNGIGNARFVAADLEKPDWPFFREPWDIVFLDPARGGAASAVAAMARMQPRTIVYVSCHPGTLARDAGELVRRQGYRMTSARVLDMFPHTHHVEVISVFDRAA